MSLSSTRLKDQGLISDELVGNEPSIRSPSRFMSLSLSGRRRPQESLETLMILKPEHQVHGGKAFQEAYGI